jgi:hypothetical protein
LLFFLLGVNKLGYLLSLPLLIGHLYLLVGFSLGFGLLFGWLCLLILLQDLLLELFALSFLKFSL